MLGHSMNLKLIYNILLFIYYVPGIKENGKKSALSKQAYLEG